MIRRLSLILLLALVACAPDAPHRVKNQVLVKTHDTGQAIKNFFTIDPAPEPELKPLPPRWCYRVQTDVLCYDHPVEHLASTLVGKQPPEGADVLAVREETQVVMRDVPSGNAGSEAAAAYAPQHHGSAGFQTTAPVDVSTKQSRYENSDRGPKVLMPNP